MTDLEALRYMRNYVEKNRAVAGEWPMRMYASDGSSCFWLTYATITDGAATVTECEAEVAGLLARTGICDPLISLRSGADACLVDLDRAIARLEEHYAPSSSPATSFFTKATTPTKQAAPKALSVHV